MWRSGPAAVERRTMLVARFSASQLILQRPSVISFPSWSYANDSGVFGMKAFPMLVVAMLLLVVWIIARLVTTTHTEPVGLLNASSARKYWPLRHTGWLLTTTVALVAAKPTTFKYPGTPRLVS